MLVFGALLGFIVFVSGCASSATQHRVSSGSPALVESDHSFEGMKMIVGYQKNYTQKEVFSTNTDGMYFSDETTHYDSGFHMPGSGLVRGFLSGLRGVLAVPCGILVTPGYGYYAPRYIGATYYVGGGSEDYRPQQYPRVGTVGPNGPCFPGYGHQRLGASRPPRR
jgi:hypothetical protein